MVRNIAILLLAASALGFFALGNVTSGSPLTFSRTATSTLASSSFAAPVVPLWPLPLNIADYDKRLLKLADYKAPVQTLASSSISIATSTKYAATSTASSSLPKIDPHAPRYSSSTNVVLPGKLWPAKAVYPNGGAILPGKRIVAYYGNFYSKNMGILGELPEEQLLAKLASTTAMWEKADPSTPVLPAIQYIAIVAQGGAGPDGKYRAVMPDEEIEHAYDMAEKIHGILIIDVQVGLSDLSHELPQFKKYLSRPDVHLAIDPEFSMKTGKRPGTVIGTMDAVDINYAIRFLDDIVKEYKLPPKVLVIHRFTEAMVTNYQDITPTKNVEVVMNMDGWGSHMLKIGTYTSVIAPEPVQFTGLKIFYKNDLKPPSLSIFTPDEALKLYPKPIYIQYQ